jgi:hypothetical protein
MASGTVLTLADSPPCSNAQLYRSVVDALQYATLTRVDITYLVNKVSHYMHQPNEDHWSVVKRIHCYISGTLTSGLQFHINSPRLQRYRLGQ